MEEIKRYDFQLGGDGYLQKVEREEYGFGDYVMYSDHKNVVDKLNSKLRIYSRILCYNNVLRSAIEWERECRALMEDKMTYSGDVLCLWSNELSNSVDAAVVEVNRLLAIERPVLSIANTVPIPPLT